MTAQFAIILNSRAIQKIKTMTYYDQLGVSPDADLHEIREAYLNQGQRLAADAERLGATECEARLKRLQNAFDVLSSPPRRREYDKELEEAEVARVIEKPVYTAIAHEATKWSPIRRLLTVIASVMVIGLVIQVVVMFNAYRNARALMGAGQDISAAQAEKVYLQDFYQTYGIRAASRAEAELLLADMKRKEEAEREIRQQEQAQADQERALRRFEEESRREGREVSASLRRAEREAERAKAEEERRREDAERMKQANELERINRALNNIRSSGSGGGDSE